MNAFALAAPLAPAMRARLGAHLRDLLAWQRSLRDWPAPMRAPDATPFVSVYANGELRGCFASDDGSPGERLARAFLLAAHDKRFGGLGAAHRDGAVVVLSYGTNARPIDASQAASEIEIGVEGLVFVREGVPPVILLPQVARDRRFDGASFVQALAQKAKASLESGALFAFEATDILSIPAKARKRDPIALAADHLETLVARDGAVTFAVDARTGARTPIGPMHHGRASVVVRALDAAGRKDTAARVRRRLERDVESALGGRPPPGWPEDEDRAAGTLALVALAGVGLRDALRRARPTSAWHTAQVALALGDRALVRTCAADLDEKPWAPWTLLAARATGETTTARRIARTLVQTIRKDRPHRGGVTAAGPVPEVALTAIAVEALAEEGERAAIARAREFLLRWQSVPHGPVDPRVAAGAFPLSPIDDRLRCDVTAHALLALLS